MSDAAGGSRTLTLVFSELLDSTALKTQRGDQTVGEPIEQGRLQLDASDCGPELGDRQEA